MIEFLSALLQTRGCNESCFLWKHHPGVHYWEKMGELGKPVIASLKERLGSVV
jgi:hypothetical protein